MAKHCTNCGQELPNDDAQFCSRCGMLVASQPTNPPAKNTGVPNPGISQLPATPLPETQRDKPVLREQIAQQPKNRLPSLPPEHPGWMSSLGREHSSPDLAASPPLPPSLSKQTQPEPDEPSSARALHVKVWNSDASNAYSPPTTPSLKGQESSDEEGASSSYEPLSAEEQRLAAIEEIPTRGMPSVPASDATPPHKDRLSPSPPLRSPLSEPGLAAVEEIPTRRMPLTPAQRDVLADLPANKVTPLPPTDIEEIARVDTLMLSSQPVNSPPAYISPPTPAEVLAPVQPPPSTLKRRNPLLIPALVLLALFVSAALWIVLARPFSVPAVTQPWQNFTDAGTGIVLQYPTGWLSAASSKGSISLHDSSNTAFVMLSTTTSTGNDATHVLQQQATKIGMTGVKALAPLSFAGVKWQRQQGSVQINGATYTMTLFAASHGKYLYTFGQLAAQSVYNDYEQAIFGPMRASLRFL